MDEYPISNNDKRIEIGQRVVYNKSGELVEGVIKSIRRHTRLDDTYASAKKYHYIHFDITISNSETRLLSVVKNTKGIYVLDG